MITYTPDLERMSLACRFRVMAAVDDFVAYYEYQIEA